MPKVIKKPKNPKVASDKAYCRKCQRTIALSNFYEATNPMLDTNGYMSICKDCCKDLYEHYFVIYNNIEIAINLTCRDLDICFNQEALRQTQSHIENLMSRGKKADAVFGYYKSKLGSTGKNNDRIDSFRYKDSDNLTDFEEVNSNDNNNSNINIMESDFELTEEIVRYWGKGKDRWEYEFLQDEIIKLKIDFECSDYGMEMIMKDICFINLAIEGIRQGIDSGDTTRLIDARSKLMNDGNLKPVQSTGADKNEKMSLGVFIKKWENERPISKTLDDEIKTYIDTYMVGHLAKMEGLNNEAVKKYEEAIKEYTIDIADIKQQDVDD